MTTDHAHSAPETQSRAHTGGSLAIPVNSESYPRRSCAPSELTITEGFWAQRQHVNATTTLAHCLYWITSLGWIQNFTNVARGTTGAHHGWQFADSEVYKLMEALAWEYGRTANPEANQTFEKLTWVVISAQDPDGYLNTAFGHPNQPPRYSDLSSGHELYCMGHMLQAAVARVRTFGEDDFTAAARKAADHICRTFGPDGNQGFCGHPEIELGLVEFGRAVDEPRYLSQAALFVERRGHRTLPPPALLSSDYFQDDAPVRSKDAWSGHAVRALYLACAATDVAVDTHDHELLEALAGQWHHTVARRTYITGGMGSRHQDEGFGEDWELPTDRAYCETCAGVASLMVSWRLYLATGAVEYVDQLERTLFNVLAGAVNPSGDAFFYANTLFQRSEGHEIDGISLRAESSLRAPWFDVACCPTNLARTIASLNAYVASVDTRPEAPQITLALLIPCDINLSLPAGPAHLSVRTSYPASGRVDIALGQWPAGASLRLRVPAWCSAASISRTGETRSVSPGWVTLRGLESGEKVTLTIDISARISFPDPRVDAARGSVAVERGPLVMCLEGCDIPENGSLDDVVVNPQTLAEDPNGSITIHGSIRHPDAQWRLPYGPKAATDSQPATFRLIPYYTRALRGTSVMRVFLPYEDPTSTKKRGTPCSL
ncbi:MAG: glycoside hydrolase family 127 protein [Ancrocorticia sp.]|jgi:DUF1680 family protein|nr:glycoside hydrolase family 127 protein [Ancrocorticia sp.]MCI2002488.1 glycoside hydrolase family 127 protein [Ancrocorticia sp.]MCI2012796.1 glycoside hydrolase family 127 protein [Ancrocorticia sp.]MCI2029373.1 glycoside hydrolase family 127 protein [Ancrocorticia sp.]